ncbi:MAG TPA: hypothetical protein VGK93_07960 [Candidatus Eisenbacteria bacterium]|jgi:hypothetical protein
MDRNVHKPLGRFPSAGLLMVLLGTVTLVLEQCTMTNDLVGVGLTRAATTGCVQRCNDQYTDLFKLEQKRHLAALEVCQQIEDNKLRNDCLQAESATHEANKDDLTANKIACQDGCHHQGTGSAG